MSLFRSLTFSRRLLPDRFQEISERVYVFDCCLSPKELTQDEYKSHIDAAVAGLQKHHAGASFMVFNFKEGEDPSLLSDLLAHHEMTVVDYPRNNEGYPIPPLEMIHYFLRSSESWLSLEGQRNVILMHCERGAWPVLAFMLAGLVLYNKKQSGEQRALEMMCKKAPKELLTRLSAINPRPSQIRYLKYISERSLTSEWPPSDARLAIDSLVLMNPPLFDGGKGFRPAVHVYGQGPTKNSKRPKLLYSSLMSEEPARHYDKEECLLVNLGIDCRVQGDVFLECIHLGEDLVTEEKVFKVMFHTAFVQSCILSLGADEVDVLWNPKIKLPNDFRAEVFFSKFEEVQLSVAREVASSKEVRSSIASEVEKSQEVQLSVVREVVSSEKAQLDVAGEVVSSEAVLLGVANGAVKPEEVQLSVAHEVASSNEIHLSVDHEVVSSEKAKLGVSSEVVSSKKVQSSIVDKVKESEEIQLSVGSEVVSFEEAQSSVASKLASSTEVQSNVPREVASSVEVHPSTTSEVAESEGVQLSVDHEVASSEEVQLSVGREGAQSSVASEVKESEKVQLGVGSEVASFEEAQSSVASEVPDSKLVQSSVTGEVAKSEGVQLSVDHEVASSEEVQLSVGREGAQSSVASEVKESEKVQLGVGSEVASFEEAQSSVASEVPDSKLVQSSVTSEVAKSEGVQLSVDHEVASSEDVQLSVGREIASCEEAQSSVASEVKESEKVQLDVGGEVASFEEDPLSVASEVPDSKLVQSSVTSEAACPELVQLGVAREVVKSEEVQRSVSIEMVCSEDFRVASEVAGSKEVELGVAGKRVSYEETRLSVDGGMESPEKVQLSVASEAVSSEKGVVSSEEIRLSVASEGVSENEGNESDNEFFEAEEFETTDVGEGKSVEVYEDRQGSVENFVYVDDLIYSDVETTFDDKAYDERGSYQAPKFDDYEASDADENIRGDTAGVDNGTSVVYGSRGECEWEHYKTESDIETSDDKNGSIDVVERRQEASSEAASLQNLFKPSVYSQEIAVVEGDADGSELDSSEVRSETKIMSENIIELEQSKDGPEVDSSKVSLEIKNASKTTFVVEENEEEDSPEAEVGKNTIVEGGEVGSEETPLEARSELDVVGVQGTCLDPNIVSWNNVGVGGNEIVSDSGPSITGSETYIMRENVFVLEGNEDNLEEETPIEVGLEPGNVIKNVLEVEGIQNDNSEAAFSKVESEASVLSKSILVDECEDGPEVTILEAGFELNNVGDQGIEDLHSTASTQTRCELGIMNQNETASSATRSEAQIMTENIGVLEGSKHDAEEETYSGARSKPNIFAIQGIEDGSAETSSSEAGSETNVINLKIPAMEGSECSSEATSSETGSELNNTGKVFLVAEEGNGDDKSEAASSEAGSEISTISRQIPVIAHSKEHDVKVVIEPKKTGFTPQVVQHKKNRRKPRLADAVAKVTMQKRIVSMWVPRAKETSPENSIPKPPVYKWVPKESGATSEEP